MKRTVGDLLNVLIVDWQYAAELDVVRVVVSQIAYHTNSAGFIVALV